MKYSETAEFSNDFKKLAKRFKTLDEDFEIMKNNAIELYHGGKINNQSIFPISGFCSDLIKICKVKKFACKSLTGRGCKSGLRVIYAYHTDCEEIVFIEIYFKADQDNQRDDRIRKYLKF